MQPVDHPSSSSAARELQVARQRLREGQLAAAEEVFRRVLQLNPDHAEALQFLGNAARKRGDNAEAVNLLSRAAKADPTNIDTLVQLGTAYRAAERLDAARYVLERAVRLAGGHNAFARLTLASLLELDQRPDLALPHYCLALSEAQQARRWTADDRNASGLTPLVEHARQYVTSGRRAWFDAALKRVNIGSGQERHRIDQALTFYLEGRLPAVADARQRPGPLHLPQVTATCFLDNARFGWLEGAAARIGACASELGVCIAAAAVPGQAPAPNARVSVLHRGAVQYEARRHAPQLQRVLAQLPLARVPHFAPDVEILALNGDSRLPLSYGRANSLCTVVFNPGSSAFEVIVGREKRVLGVGGVLALDASFGVECAHAGEGTACALSMEVWHPELSEPEQQALSALFMAAVDFDSHLQELK